LKQHSRSESGLCFVSHSCGVSELLRSLKLFYWIITPLPEADAAYIRTRTICQFFCLWLPFESDELNSAVDLLLSCMDMMRWAEKLFKWLVQVVG